jgi:IclR family acetate operon transcriptional repressor
MRVQMSRTAARAFDLFETAVYASSPLGLMDIVELTGVDKSTTQRLLVFLVERGLLTKDELTKQYKPGPGAFAMAAAISARSDIRALVAPRLGPLRDLSGETISMHLAVGGRRVCVDGVESEEIIRRVIPLGESLPLYQGPSGKAILAYLPQSEVEALFDAGKLGKAERQRIERDLVRIREQGYLLTEGDRSIGVRAVSAPIFGVRGVMASLTIAGPSERWTEAKARSCVLALIESTTAISRSLGGKS